MATRLQPDPAGHLLLTDSGEWQTVAIGLEMQGAVYRYTGKNEEQATSRKENERIAQGTSASDSRNDKGRNPEGPAQGLRNGAWEK